MKRPRTSVATQKSSNPPTSRTKVLIWLNLIISICASNRERQLSELKISTCTSDFPLPLSFLLCCAACLVLPPILTSLPEADMPILWPPSLFALPGCLALNLDSYPAAASRRIESASTARARSESKAGEVALLDIAFWEASTIWPFEGGIKIERRPAGLLPFFRELEATAALEAVFDGVCLLLLAERVEAKSGLHLPKPSVNVAMVIRSLYAVLPEKKNDCPLLHAGTYSSDCFLFFELVFGWGSSVADIIVRGVLALLASLLAGPASGWWPAFIISVSAMIFE